MPRGVLFYHVFHVVRFQRFSKSLACDKILELHGNKTNTDRQYCKNIIMTNREHIIINITEIGGVHHCGYVNMHSVLSAIMKFV